MKKILIMGLPGSGKSYFAEQLKKYLKTSVFYKPAEIASASCPDVKWINADDVRKKYNDWDFSHEGRMRQSIRMRELADSFTVDFVIADFIAPLPEMRHNFKADWVIWMDTIDKGRFEDTNKMFVPPEMYDFRITEQNAEKWAEFVGEHILENKRRPTFQSKKETVMQMGRFQPWHKGHRALFERLIARTGQVCIMIRDCQGWNQTNPFSWSEVKQNIKKDLDPLFQGQYEIVVIPNIVHIGWGRDVGYTMQQEVFDESIHSISATNIRKEMGLE
jgi:nicotinamide riboside kinase